jgi:hypothetical protein
MDVGSPETLQFDVRRALYVSNVRGIALARGYRMQGVVAFRALKVCASFVRERVGGVGAAGELRTFSRPTSVSTAAPTTRTSAGAETTT